MHDVRVALAQDGVQSAQQRRRACGGEREKKRREHGAEACEVRRARSILDKLKGSHGKLVRDKSLHELQCEARGLVQALARARKKNGGVDVVKVAGVNHLLVPAKTGEVDEYDRLGNVSVSPEVTNALTAWLTRTGPSK